MSRQKKQGNNNNRKRRTKIRKDRVLILIIALIAALALIGFGVKSLIGIFSSSNNQPAKTITTKTTNNKNKETTKEDEPIHKTYKIVVDAGHGGKDQGSAGVNNTIEKDINLQVSKLVGSKLSKYSDIEVIMTRNEDTFVTIPDRIKMANEMKADLYISIHSNAQVNRQDAYGIETYHKTDATEASKAFAKSIQSTLSLYVNAKDRGVIPRDYDVIKFTKTTAALVEVGFITNKDEEAKLTNKTYQEQLAEGITQGILSYLDKLKAQH